MQVDRDLSRASAALRLSPADASLPLSVLETLVAAPRGRGDYGLEGENVEKLDELGEEICGVSILEMLTRSNSFIIEFRTRLMRRLDEERALKSKFE